MEFLWSLSNEGHDPPLEWTWFRVINFTMGLYAYVTAVVGYTLG